LSGEPSLTLAKYLHSKVSPASEDEPLFLLGTIPLPPLAWVEKHCRRKKTGASPIVETRQTYVRSAKAAGLAPVSANAFGRAMSELGFTRKKIRGVFHYMGLELNEPVRLAVSN
jgi:hypothetical protein